MRVHGIKIHPWRVCERFCIWVVKYYACQPSFFSFFFFLSPAALSGEPRQRIKSPASLSYICRSLTCAPSGCLGFLSGRQVCREYGPEATEPPPHPAKRNLLLDAVVLGGLFARIRPRHLVTGSTESRRRWRGGKYFSLFCQQGFY